MTTDDDLPSERFVSFAPSASPLLRALAGT